MLKYRQARFEKQYWSQEKGNKKHSKGSLVLCILVSYQCKSLKYNMADFYRGVIYNYGMLCNFVYISWKVSLVMSVIKEWFDVI